MLYVLLLWLQSENFRGSPAVARDDGTAVTPRYMALLIGIKDYDHLDSLSAPEKDVSHLAEVLVERFHFQVVQQLLSQDMQTREMFEYEIDRFLEVVKPGDYVLVYYAGHGIEDQKTGRYFWCPVDSDKHDTTTMVRVSDVIDNLVRSLSQNHVLLLSDSCYAGAVFDSADKRREYRNTSGVQKGSRSFWLLTSSNYTRAMDQSLGRGLSPYAYWLIHYLKNTDKPYSEPVIIQEHIAQGIAGLNEEILSQEGFQVPKCGPLNDRRVEQRGVFMFWNPEARDKQGRPYPPPWEREDEDELDALLAQLVGRRIRVVYPTDKLCSDLEDLGLEVTCDEMGRSRFRKEITFFCSDISPEVGQALKDQLKLRGFKIRSHGNDPSNFKNHHCGEPDEITLFN